MVDIHAQRPALFSGGGDRICGLFESAQARPVNKFACGETNLLHWRRLLFSMARNPPIADGNCIIDRFS
jgi:hypothetical protein